MNIYNMYSIYHKIIYGITFAVILAACSFPVAESKKSVFDHWGKLHARLDDTLPRLEEKQTLPDDSWNPLKKDKKSVDKKIDAMLDDAIEILNISDVSSVKAQINDHQSDIRKYKKNIAELRTKKMMAPEDEEAWKIWASDVKDYEEKIAAYTEKISAGEQAIDELRAKMQALFSQEGIDLDSEQLDTLIYSVTGDDDIEIFSVFKNIKAITSKLQDLTEESGEDIDSAKRYYGMHVLLVKILVNLQQRYIDRVDDRYMPELAVIETDNRQLMQQTRSLLKTSEPQHKKVYQTNLAAQKLTDRTVSLYRQYLGKNRARMSGSLKKTLKEYQAAENTYLTVSTSYALIALLRDADKLYSSINELQIPELLPFQNKAMKAEFRKLSGKMQEE